MGAELAAEQSKYGSVAGQPTSQADDDAQSDLDALLRSFAGAAAASQTAAGLLPGGSGASNEVPNRGWGEASAAAVAAAANIADPAMAGGGKLSERPVQISVGSIGHPHACAPACRYVKRRGGCRDGVTCTNCHMCFWRRVSPLETVPPPPRPYEDIARPDQIPQCSPCERALSPSGAVRASVDAAALGLPSAGTWGHPHRCGLPCKYVRRKTGCRDGLDCRKCHRCHWQRGLPPRPGDAAAERLAAAAAAAAEGTHQGRGVAEVEPSETERASDMLQKLIRLQLFVHDNLQQATVA